MVLTCYLYCSVFVSLPKKLNMVSSTLQNSLQSSNDNFGRKCQPSQLSRLSAGSPFISNFENRVPILPEDHPAPWRWWI